MKKTRRQRINLFDKSLAEMKHAIDTFTKKELQYELDHRADRDYKDEAEKISNMPLLHLNNPDHPKPVTRRDFLARGMLATTASFLIPQMPSLLRAATICPPTATGLTHIPFFTLDGAGGFSMAATNFIVGATTSSGPGADYFANYNSQGLPTGQRPQDVAPSMAAGLAMHPTSFILQGIQSRASAAALAKTSGFVVCVASGDDSGANKQIISHQLAAGGLVGELASTIGSSTKESGGNSSSLVSIPAYVSTQVRNPAQAAQLNTPGTLLTVMGTQPQANKVVQGVADLTSLGTNKLNPTAVAQATKDVINCGATKNIENFKSQALNIAGDANITGIFTGVGGGNGDDPAVGSAVALALAGKVGPATISFGGADYHGNGDTVKRNFDNRIGAAIGGIIEYCNRVNQPAIINVITDGSVSCNGTDQGPLLTPSGDNGNNGLNVMFVFDPQGKVPVTKPQLGKFGSGGVVANATPWSNNPAMGATVMLANYFYLMNQDAVFNKLYPTPGFNVADVIAFGRRIK